MSEERRQQFLTRAIAAMNSGDYEAYGAMFAEDVLVYTPGSAEPSRGRAGRVGWVADLFAAFPDGVATIMRSFYAGDFGCVEYAFAGTHSGPLKGAGGIVPPTNAKVAFPYCISYTYGEDDLATEVREYYDQMELLGPLGLVKPADS